MTPEGLSHLSAKGGHPMTEQELCRAAIAMLDRSYSPYSHFPVGAVLECSDGNRDFKRIVIAGKSEDYCVPCGSCRQVMQEFAPQMEVICLNGKGEAKHFALKELLPYGFDETWL